MILNFSYGIIFNIKLKARLCMWYYVVDKMSLWKNNYLHNTKTHKLSNALTELTSQFFIELSDSSQST